MPYWDVLTDRSLWLQLGILVVVTLATYLLLPIALRIVSRQLAQRDKISHGRAFHVASA